MGLADLLQVLGGEIQDPEEGILLYPKQPKAQE